MDGLILNTSAVVVAGILVILATSSELSIHYPTSQLLSRLYRVDQGVLWLVSTIAERFLQRNAMHARYMLWPCVCVCVCLCVCHKSVSVNHCKSKPADEKYSIKGARSGSGDRFRILHAVKYLRNG